MDEKMKELIAIGASVTAHCQPCVTYHVGKAKELGVDDEQVQEAIRVGQMVERGAGSAMREFVQGLFARETSAGCCTAAASDAGRHCCG